MAFLLHKNQQEHFIFQEWLLVVVGGWGLAHVTRLGGELDELQIEIATWAEKSKQRGVDWQFKIDDARQKLKRLYPKIKD